MILSEAVEIFMDAKLADGIADTTASWYHSRLSRLVEYLGDCDLADVDVMQLRRFVVSLRRPRKLYANHPYRDSSTGTLSPSTIHSYVRVVRHFFRWFHQAGTISVDPARSIKPPKMQRTAPKDVTEDTMKELLRACRGIEPGQLRDRALILFLADTGCRVGGLVGLRIRDLDLGERVAMVTEKGSKSRMVLFTDRTAKALQRYLDHRLRDSAWVFPNLKTGDKMQPSSVNHILKRVAKRADLPNVRCNPHGFRHAFAHAYIVNGGDLASLSRILGHADVTITNKFYLRFQVDELKQKHRRFSPVAKLHEGPTGTPNSGTASHE